MTSQRPVPVARRAASLIAVVVLGLTGALLGASPASAATYAVTNGNDAGAGSLRQAITSANANAGIDTIEISYNAAPIAPLSQLPLLFDDTVIVGTVPGVVIDGVSAGVLAVGLGAALCFDLSIENLTVTRFNGVGIYIPCGVAHLADVIAIDNDNQGIFVSGTEVELLDLTLTDNGSNGLLVLLGDVGATAVIDGVTVVGSTGRPVQLGASPGAITATNISVDGGLWGIELDADATVGAASVSLTSSTAVNSTFGVDVQAQNGATADLDDVRVSLASFIGITIETETAAHVELSNSDVTDSASGLSIYALTASSVRVENSDFTNNDGGGVAVAADGAGSLVELSGLRSSGNGNPALGDGGGYRASMLAGSRLTMDGCEASSNLALRGAGLMLDLGADSTAVIDASQFTDNDGFEGGGMFVRGVNGSGTLSVADSEFRGNTVENSGGGIHFDGIGDGAATGGVSIDRTTIADNTAGGNGGGINGTEWGYNPDVAGTALWIADSTISGNSSGALGGGIHINNQLTIIDGPVDMVLRNSTVSGNVALAGGGIAIGTLLQEPQAPPMTLTIAHSTVVDNSAQVNNGGGVRLSEYVQAVYFHSVLANNGSEDSLRNGGTTVLDVDHSLVESPDAATQNAMGLGAGNLSGLDPQLGPLTDNGGTTLTHLPLAGSPLINAGDAAVSGAPALDQRERARIIGAAIDIGAVETQPMLAATGVDVGRALTVGGIAALGGLLVLLLARRRVRA